LGLMAQEKVEEKGPQVKRRGNQKFKPNYKSSFVRRKD
jgi:hypothetical protein